MINTSLLDLHYIFRQACEGKDPREWVKPVQIVRMTIKAAAKYPPAALELLDKTCEIALVFGKGWRLPIAIHLLALLPHALDQRTVYEKLWTHLRLTSKQASEHTLDKWKMTRSTEDEFDRCAIYWQNIHAPPSMPELIRGKSIMRKLFVVHTQGG